MDDSVNEDKKTVIKETQKIISHSEAETMNLR